MDGQVFFGRDALAGGTAPSWPVVGLGGKSQQEAEQKERWFHGVGNVKSDGGELIVVKGADSLLKGWMVDDGFERNPFAGLSAEGLPPGPAEVERALKKKSRGRVDIIRQTAGRGGKTVTVVTNFVGIGLPEKEKLAKEMQKACGVGGTVKEGRIEIQGDKRAEVARILEGAGFRPVFAGG